MIYLVDPDRIGNRPPCPFKCTVQCGTNCGIKPLYGIDPVPL